MRCARPACSHTFGTQVVAAIAQPWYSRFSTCPGQLTRAENIRRNNQYLLSLGLDVAAEQVRKPKPPPKPKSPKPITEVKASRSSSRLCGLPADPVEDLEPEPAWEPDEKKPKRGEAGLSCWWLPATECDPLGPPRPPLTECQELALLTPLTSEQRESLVLEGGEEEGDWVTEMLRFLRAYGAQRPEAFCVPSVANFKKVIDTLSGPPCQSLLLALWHMSGGQRLKRGASRAHICTRPCSGCHPLPSTRSLMLAIVRRMPVLASGDGVTCAYRGGTFDAGVKYTPKHDLDEVRALSRTPNSRQPPPPRAQRRCPLIASPLARDRRRSAERCSGSRRPRTSPTAGPSHTPSKK